MTQMAAARNGTVTEAMRRVAEREAVDSEFVREQVADGQAVIPANVGQAYHDQTLPGDNYKEARFCSMCGVELCSMRIDQDAREDGEMAEIETDAAARTDLAESPAAEVNGLPVGTHDGADTPDLTGDTNTATEGCGDE